MDFLKGEEGKKYHTVVLDSLTEIAQQVLAVNLHLHARTDGRLTER